MPIETLSDIVEELANDLGIYGSHVEEHSDSDGQCECRVCWASGIISRIKAAIEVERKINRIVDEQQ